jgi:hypothetical protein
MQAEKILRSVGEPDPATGCREWTRARMGAGYGNVFVGGRMIGAHRAVYELAHGPIPEGMQVCHTCDNPPCCNVDHLFLGTAADNTLDKVKKGRASGPQGRSNPLTRLTPEQVVSIRQAHKPQWNGPHSYAGLARQYGVSKSTIAGAVQGRSWAYIGGVRQRGQRRYSHSSLPPAAEAGR